MSTNLNGILGLCITRHCKDDNDHDNCPAPSTPCVCECHNESRAVAMCELCFGVFRADQLYRDANGDLWDVCVECKTNEDRQK